MSSGTDWNAADAARPPGIARRLANAFARLRSRSTLRSTGAHPLAGDAAPRVVNVVTGLAERLSVPAPGVYAYEGVRNAFVVRAARVVAFEQSYLDSLTRTETEAVAAWALVHLGPGARLGDGVGDRDDVRAVALTRFPPALASALGKAQPVTGSAAPLYLAADHPSHVPVAERIAQLEDL